jgi:acyl-CoA synthetase (AMP-forming)/AMP-acid ligase II
MHGCAIRGEANVGEIRDDTTIGAVFAAAVSSHADRPLLAIPANDKRGYLPAGLEMSYAEAGARVAELSETYARAGYGPGHRVATLLENRPEHILHKLALNGLGACCVPINPDYRAGETAYLLEHSKPDLLLTIGAREGQVREALAQSGHQPPVALSERVPGPLPKASRAVAGDGPTPETPASILYTSGTTGRPKGCILSHGYEVSVGFWYTSLGGLATIRQGQERIYNPLPLYHANAGVVSLMGAIVSGNCQIQPDRFHPHMWWREIAQTRATIVHYLGIIAPLLLGQPASAEDRRHGVRFGLGAGIEPQLHAPFEERFGFPLIELWGMTEMVRVLSDAVAPRQVGTRAFGRAVPGVEVRVVDEHDRDVPAGETGEMLIRHSAATPRRG